MEKILSSLLTKANATLKSKIMFKFSAHWCKPCLKMKDIFEQSSREYVHNCLFCEIDIDDSDGFNFTEIWKITFLPTFVIFDVKTKTILKQWDGCDKKEFLSNVLKYL